MGSSSVRRSEISLVGGMVALAFAGAGEMLVASDRNLPLAASLYLLGIGIFAASARRDARLGTETSPRPAEGKRDLPVESGSGKLLVGGMVSAVALGIAAVPLLLRDIRSLAGTWLWLASVAVLGATAIASHGAPGWPARWGASAWPKAARERRLLLVSLLLLLAVAAASRLLLLDSIPFGINPDEGDRAAESIRILRGVHPQAILEAGWYRISMIYFWLLAQWMKLVGIGYAQARAFGAQASILSIAVVAWIGIRHFSVRVGLLAGFLLASLGVSLQFARETSEAGPTATLWAISIALFLEGARRGKPSAWIGTGLFGGFSVYFYPTGRLWAVMAAGLCIYLLVHGLRLTRRTIASRVVIAAVAAILVMSPFFLLMSKNPGMFVLRAQETSIFTNNNASRLSYYKPEWSTSKLLAVQTAHSLGIFNRIGDNGGFWPTDRPILPHVLATLTLLGLAYCCLRPDDPRFVALALWFIFGFVGMVVTVGTPNVQRMATAVPVLTLFPALFMDDMAGRVEAAVAARRGRDIPAVRWATTAAAALIALWIMNTEMRFYFRDYAAIDRWSHPRIETDAVQNQGADTLVTSLGRFFHHVNSGWIGLMAPKTPRGGIEAPGSDLPLALPADRNLAFLIYPDQGFYLPYLRELYKHGAEQRWFEPNGTPVVTTYRVLRAQWAATQGALVRPEGGAAMPVDTLGQLPPGWTSYPSRMLWTAGLRAPRHSNYSFRVGPGRSRLTIDGIEVLPVATDQSAATATVALAQGWHAVAFESLATPPARPPFLEWSDPVASSSGSPPARIAWRSPRREELTPGLTSPVGLLGIVRVADRPEQRRIDGTLATCCLSEDLGTEHYAVTWSGKLTAPIAGAYLMDLFAEGAAELKVDGRTVLRTDAPTDRPVTGKVTLGAGSHEVLLEYSVNGGRGGLEWTWSPPGGSRSIVPPSVLSPPTGGGIGRAVPAAELVASTLQPVRPALAIVP